MMVDIFRNASRGYDCTNGGLSSKYDRAFVILPHYTEATQLPDDVPVLVLERHVHGCVRVRPLKDNPKAVGPMFGGNFVHTSDSRFWDAVQRLLGHRMYGAVAIHDRYE